jgi:hypothetical protein
LLSEKEPEQPPVAARRAYRTLIPDACGKTVRVIPMAWREIQALRAEPTGLAARDADRKKTFRSALRQAEELAEAADVVSYAAKPILLFYALSQAGRSLAAARIAHPWKLYGHGLEFRSEGSRVLRATVEPNEGQQAAFQAVTAAAGSPALAGKVQIGALWAANPDLIGLPIRPELGQWPVALSSVLGTRAVRRIDEEAMNPEEMPLATGGLIRARVNIPGDTAEQVAQGLEAYPTFTGAAVLKSDPSTGERYADAAEIITRTPTPDGQLGVLIAKDAPPQMSLADHWRLENTLYTVVEVDRRFPALPNPSHVGYALPAIADGPSPLPLMLWWALLLGLSSLARYEPATWTAAVDLDTSPLAVDLHAVLDIAAERVPARILDSLKPTPNPTAR